MRRRAPTVQPTFCVNPLDTEISFCVQRLDIATAPGHTVYVEMNQELRDRLMAAGNSLVMATLLATGPTVKVTKANRETGTMVVLKNWCEGDVKNWTTLCIQHESECAHESRAAAVSWMSQPSMWCSECREQVKEQS